MISVTKLYTLGKATVLDACSGKDVSDVEAMQGQQKVLGQGVAGMV